MAAAYPKYNDIFAAITALYNAVKKTPPEIVKASDATNQIIKFIQKDPSVLASTKEFNFGTNKSTVTPLQLLETYKAMSGSSYISQVIKQYDEVAKAYIQGKQDIINFINSVAPQSAGLGDANKPKPK